LNLLWKVATCVLHTLPPILIRLTRDKTMVLCATTIFNDGLLPTRP
jgi:hypothetical protein